MHGAHGVRRRLNAPPVVDPGLHLPGQLVLLVAPSRFGVGFLGVGLRPLADSRPVFFWCHRPITTRRAKEWQVCSETKHNTRCASVPLHEKPLGHSGELGATKGRASNQESTEQGDVARPRSRCQLPSVSGRHSSPSADRPHPMPPRPRIRRPVSDSSPHKKSTLVLGVRWSKIASAGRGQEARGGGRGVPVVQNGLPTRWRPRGASGMAGRIRD